MNFEEELAILLINHDIKKFNQKAFYNGVDNIKNACEKYRYLIKIAYDVGIFKCLRDSKYIDQNLFYEFTKKIENKYGINKGDADWLVYICCEIYGKRLNKASCHYWRRYITGNVLDLSPSRYDELKKESVYIFDYNDGDKYPKYLIQRELAAEEMLGIDDMTAVAIKEEQNNEYSYIRLVGEITTKRLKYDILLYFYIYNSAEELIGVSFDEDIFRSECSKIIPFTKKIQVLNEESISRIVIRTGINPACV